jgi:hypothetical protein
MVPAMTFRQLLKQSKNWFGSSSGSQLRRKQQLQQSKSSSHGFVVLWPAAQFLELTLTLAMESKRTALWHQELLQADLCRLAWTLNEAARHNLQILTKGTGNSIGPQLLATLMIQPA